MPPFRPETEYRIDRKPHDVVARPFHRINSPSYDKSVDEPEVLRPRRPPHGRAQESGARTPADYAATGLTAKLLKKVLDFIEPLLLAGIALIPVVGPFIVAFIILGRQVLKRLNIKDPIDSIKEDLAEWAGQRIEGALFDRYLRASPAWVPVGREKYGPKFVYEDDGPPRETQQEEEREVEGTLTGSFQLWNDIPPTQWTRYDRWAFHVVPMRGYAHLLGEGNVRDPDESAQMGRDALQEVLHIYGQRDSGDHQRGALECLWDTGAFSHPLKDGGSHGVMFDAAWPYWPMTGDHFWAAGRWAYDCMRPVGKGDKQDIYPTQIHPCKAIATARFEGHKFPENKGSVPAVKFLFFASTEGGYVNFRPTSVRVDDPNDKNVSTREIRQAPINLRDKDYVFIVDLPPHEEGKSPYPVGHTTDFMRNTLVLRPRLLIEVRFAPWVEPANAPKFTHGPENDPRDAPVFHELLPIVELLRPDDPTQRPTQAKVTIPLTQLPPRNDKDPEGPEVYGLDLALGWHDPDGSQAAEIVHVKARLTGLRFHGSDGPVRIKTCINGRWHVVEATADAEKFVRNEQPTPPVFRVVDLFLPKDARISVTTHGVWRHGFGEFIEGNTLVQRQLSFGGLIELHPDMQRRLDQLRRLVAQGQQLSPQEQEELEQIEELLETLDKLIGRRRKAEWLVDIDAEVAKDLAEAHRASAIARELWVRPVPVINRHDEPAGWTEFVDPDSVPHKGNHLGFVVPEPRLLGTVAKLKADQEKAGRKGTRVELVAHRFTQVGSGNNLAQLTRPTFTMFGVQEHTDYSLDLLLDIVDTAPPPPPPTPRSALLREVTHPFPFTFYGQNTALLPDFAPVPLLGRLKTIYTGPDREAAIRALIAEIRARAADVVGLSENWLGEERDRIAAAVRDLYPARRDGPHLALDFLPAGLMLLSRHPIVKSTELVYRITKGDDGLTSKGIVHARIQPAGAPCPIDVFLTHTQSPFKSGTDLIEAARLPALKAQLRILGRFVAACRNPAFPALVMGDLNVDADDPTIYQPLLDAIGGPPRDLWKELPRVNPAFKNVRGITNDFQRSFEANAEHPPKPQNHPLRHQGGFRLDYFLSSAGSIFRPEFDPVEVVLRDQKPLIDMSDHYGIAGGQTKVIEKVFDLQFPIRRVRVAFSAFKCLNVTGNNPLAEGDDDEVQFELGVRSGTIDPVTVKSKVFEGITTGTERTMDGPTIEFPADPGNGLEIRVSGKEIGGLLGDTDLGTVAVTVTRSELLAGLDVTVRRTLPLLTGADGEYAVEVAILTT